MPDFGEMPRPGGVNAKAMMEAGHADAGSPSTVRVRLHFVDAIGLKHNYLCAAFDWGDCVTEEAPLDLFATEVNRR